jgi:hypothetical protein
MEEEHMLTKSTPATQAARSWRDVLPVHPAAELFPMMSPDELRALGEDIKKNGLRSAIAVTYESTAVKFFLVDGRNRMDAMALVGIAFEVIFKKQHGQCLLVADGLDPLGSGYSAAEVVLGDPYAYVVSANIARRHLTANDKRRIITALIKANPQKSDRQIAKLVDASPTTVGDERKKTCPDLDTSIDTRGRKQKRKRRTEDDCAIEAKAREAAIKTEPISKAPDKTGSQPAAVEVATESGQVCKEKTEQTLDDARNAYIAIASKLAQKERIQEIKKLLAAFDLAIHKHFVQHLTIPRG